MSYGIMNAQLVAIHSHITAILRHVLRGNERRHCYKGLHGHIVIERKILLGVLDGTHFIDLVVRETKSRTQNKQEARTHICDNLGDCDNGVSGGPMALERKGMDNWLNGMGVLLERCI